MGLASRPIVLGLRHRLYPHEFINSSLAWDSLQVTLTELGKTVMAIFMRIYSKTAILKNGDNKNMIIILPMRAYPSATSDLGL